MIALKIFANLIMLIMGIEFIIDAMRTKKANYCPKWLWVPEFVVGIIGSLYGFTVWFVS